ncbi:MAG: glycoside hydrolase domain-containing protein [Candidatus Acidiferrum sp.]
MLVAGTVMKLRISFLFLSFMAGALILLSSPVGMRPHSQGEKVQRAYLGFDLNLFPGKTALPILRKTFAFGGYWLSLPPGEKSNTWLGKREVVRSEGFGFLLLYRGRETRELKNNAAAVRKGIFDARSAASAAKQDGFPKQSIVFLDIEEGGRLPEAYHAYLRAWAKGLAESGYRAGAYCSGMPVKEDSASTITSADDIRAHAPSPNFAFFVYNDACPPSPGCTFPQNPPSPASSGIPYAALWQFAQSPRRKEFTAHCTPGYNADGNCYAPGDTAHAWFLDVNSAASPDPSNGR